MRPDYAQNRPVLRPYPARMVSRQQSGMVLGMIRVGKWPACGRFRPWIGYDPGASALRPDIGSGRHRPPCSVLASGLRGLCGILVAKYNIPP